MKQPPNTPKLPKPPGADATAWRRPPGVSVGTWRYVHQGSIAEHYDQFVENTPLCRIDHEAVARVFGTLHAPPEDHKKLWVADLGSGTGRTSALLASLGHLVLAVDLSEPMLHELAQRQLQAVTLVRANLVQLNCLASSIVDGAVCLFSTIGMIQGREHRRTFLRHVHRIVRPGGHFLLHVHSRYASLTQAGGVKLLAKSLFESIRNPDREFGDAVYAYRGLPDMFLHRFSRREIVRDLAACNWEIEHIDRVSLDGSTILKSKLGLAGGYLIIAKRRVAIAADTPMGS